MKMENKLRVRQKKPEPIEGVGGLRVDMMLAL